MSQRTLAVLTSVHGAREGDRIILDDKAFQGIELYNRFWSGDVIWLLSMRDAPPTYSTLYRDTDLPVRVVAVNEDRSDLLSKLPSNALVLASADNPSDLALSDQLPGQVAYIIENTLQGRIDMVDAADAAWWRKLRRRIWEKSTEVKRVSAIKKAAGLQCNGLASFNKYSALSAAPMYYFDTRLSADAHISEELLAEKCMRALKGEPLRLAFSGRLTRIKGAQYLVPIAQQLRSAGINFTFEIFGEGEIALDNQFHLHGPLAFPDKWVPAMQNIDLFICPHPQGDPSCTYLEVMGCGVGTVGFANEALRSMVAADGNGLTVPIGDIGALVRTVLALDRDREQLVALMKGAAAFAAKQSMEDAFRKRVDHLRSIGG